MDPNSTVVNDKIQGLGYKGNTSGTINISTFSLGAGATQTFTTTITHANQQAMSANQVRFAGVGNSTLNNKWAVMGGSLYFRNTGYDINAVVTRLASGQLVTVVIKNPTGISQTIPNITVSIRSYYYAPSW